MKYYVWFLKIDTSGDGKLNLQEFKKAEKLIESHWNEDINCEKVFKEIDNNNGGSILFTEFAHYCIEKSIKL
jgi:Ca2+-binding EF-hand superfamily protein